MTIIIASTDKPMRIVSALATRLVWPLSLSKKPRPENSEINIITNKVTSSTLTNNMKEDTPVDAVSASIPQPSKPARRPNLIQLNFSGWRFSAPLMPILAVLFVLPLLGSLGFWQLDRAHQKEQLQAASAAQMAAEPQQLSTQQLNSLEQRYSKVKLQGQLVDGEQQLLLDNRVNKGQAGYEVLVPMLLDDGGVILVNRGWLPVGESREIKPAVALQGERVSVEGLAAIPPQRFNLGEALMADDQWPKVLQFEDFDAIGAALKVKLIPRILHPSRDSDWTFERIWQAVEAGPAKNYGYAMQWFALMVALAVLVLFTCLKRADAEDN